LDDGVNDEGISSAELIPLRPRRDGEAPAAMPSTTQATARELPYTSFDRRELSEILKVYGRMVAAGEWRDYAIDHLKDRAVFSIFRRASEVPLYRIEKNPKLARKQGAYAVITQTGMILKRGSDLARVIRVLDKSLSLVDA
jgi:hypothetical protein